MTSEILRVSEVHCNNIIYDELDVTSDKKYAMAKIWYKDGKSATKSSRAHSMLIQTCYLEIDQLTTQNNLSLVLTEKTKNIFDEIDQKSVDFLKTRDISRKFGLNDVKYKSIAMEISRIKNNETCDALVFQLLPKNSSIKFFVADEDKEEKKFEDIKSLLAGDCTVKVILEVVGIMINLETHKIVTNIVPRQILIKNVKPTQIELTEYSFVDSDDENHDDVKSQTVANSVKHQEVPKKVSTKKILVTESSDDSQPELDDDSHSESDSPDVESFVAAFSNGKFPLHAHKSD